MKTRGVFYAALAMLAGAAGGFAHAQTPEKGGLDETGPYSVVENWFKPGFERWSEPVIAVTVDTPNRILFGAVDDGSAHAGSLIVGADGAPLKDRRAAGQRGNDQPVHRIMALNADGKATEDWSQWNDLISVPHDIQISPYDPERHVWVVDRAGQILKFTNDGKTLVLKLGEKNVTGSDHAHFNWPAAIAFLPDGSFYVADGYRNTRVIKFDKDGKFQLEWGTKGSGPGQFDLVHGVAIDRDRHVYVADRSNNRIQVFDASGKFLDQWPNINHPTRLMTTEDGALWLASGTIERMAKFDLKGHRLTYWGAHGDLPGEFDNLHSFAVDAAGNLYVADTWNNRVQKFAPRAGADKARMVAQPLTLKR